MAVEISDRTKDRFRKTKSDAVFPILAIYKI